MAKTKSNTARKRNKSKNKAKPKSRTGTKTKVRPDTGRRKSTPRNTAMPRFATLQELRGHIDALDDLIVPLLCRRLRLVTSAAQFKPSVGGVVVPARVEEIVARVRALAQELGGDADCMEDVYRHLIDAFTREEQRRWRALNVRET